MHWVREGSDSDDGTPRVVPTWFEWNGTEIVMVTYVAGPNVGIRHSAARIAALRANSAVALTIDTEQFPSQSPTMRGRAEIDEVDGLAPEYVASAHRYLGDAAAAEMLTAMDQPQRSRPGSWCARPGSGSWTSPRAPARSAACETCAPALEALAVPEVPLPLEVE